MFITIHVRVDDRVDALRIAAEHLSNGHWVAIEGLCDLSDDQVAADVDQLVKQVAH